MERTKWTERTFNFDFPPGLFPNIIERLTGTPSRLNEMVKLVNEEEAAKNINAKWSIKEHIGHLSDLEDLHENRIDDFLMGKDILQAADMKNLATYEANHNEKKIPELLNEFSIKRKRLVNRLESLEESIHSKTALHPRLGVRMRPVDLAYFTAEHDDHHLASIREIIRLLLK